MEVKGAKNKAENSKTSSRNNPKNRTQTGSRTIMDLEKSSYKGK